MKNEKLTIGVLGIQGSREEHQKLLKRIGCLVVYVRNAEDLDKISGLIIPGGESTAIGKLLNWKTLSQSLKNKIQYGLPVWGTCAGAILLAKKGSPYSLNLLDAEIKRNAYGRQVNSFITNIKIPIIDNRDFEIIFIRAPKFQNIDKNIKVLASIQKEPIFIQQNNILASTFHPELTEDTAIHEYFVEMCRKYKNR